MKYILIILMLLSLNSCYTMSNLSGQKIDFQGKDAPPKGAVYGGVKLYVSCSDYPLWFGLDFPFSLVLDTLLLPYTLIKDDSGNINNNSEPNDSADTAR